MISAGVKRDQTPSPVAAASTGTVWPPRDAATATTAIRPNAIRGRVATLVAGLVAAATVGSIAAPPAVAQSTLGRATAERTSKRAARVHRAVRDQLPAVRVDRRLPPLEPLPVPLRRHH